MAPGFNMAAKAKTGKGEKAWLGSLLTGMTVGLVAFGYISLFGHTHEFLVPWQPPWGLLVTSFEFFVLCGAGLALVAGNALMLGGERFRGLSRRMSLLAILAIVIGFALVAIELTQPTRLSMAPELGPDFRTALLLDLLWFSLALGSIFFLLWRLRRPGTRGAAALGWGAFLLVFAGIRQMGAVFRHYGHPPEWLVTPVFVDYLLAALVSGLALGALIVHLHEKFAEGRPLADPQRLAGRLLRWLTGALALYGAWLLIVTTGAATGLSWHLHQAVPFLVAGPLAFTFWGLQCAVGLFAPLTVLAANRRLSGWTAGAAGLVLIGQFFRSYNMITAGQLKTFHTDSSFLVKEGLLSLAPCIPKTTVVVGAVCLFLWTMTLSEKLAPWGEDELR